MKFFYFLILLIILSVWSISTSGNLLLHIKNVKLLNNIDGKSKYLPASVNNNETCHQTWLRVIITHNSHSLLSDVDIDPLIGCGAEYSFLLKAISPSCFKCAAKAVAEYPKYSAFWFWVGESSVTINPDLSRKAYNQYTTMAPYDGLGWCRLGFANEKMGDVKNALHAFLNCCNNGDRGSNGCYGVGRIFEKLGNPQKAIEYYRLSHWEGSLKRADELESQLGH